jgi:predicted ester cyclase
LSNENKNLVRRWVEEILNGRNFDVCAEVMADTYIEHAVALFGREAPGAVPGSDHMRATAQWLFEQFSDMHFAIEDLIAENDIVAAGSDLRAPTQGGSTA